jgi:CPA2 family monovalent cation:H+ antiporter-2
MVVGQSPVSQQAAADALPLRDAFAVLFFTSVGMLFDPKFLVHEPWLVLAGLAVVMVAKPLAALAIVAVIGYPPRTALTVALGLAQIGEFSFILSEANVASLSPNTLRPRSLPAASSPRRAARSAACRPWAAA